MRPALLAAAVALIAVAAGVAVAGARGQRHQLGSNYVPFAIYSAVVPSGQTVCQPGQNVPAGTGALRMLIGTYDAPGPRVDVSVAGRGGPALRGGLAPGWSQGGVVIPMATAQHERVNARVCLRNHGPGRIALAGGPRTAAVPASVGRAATADPIRLEFLQGRSQSWWGFVPSLIDRVSAVRDAFPGGATLILWAVLALATLAGAVKLVLGEARR